MLKATVRSIFAWLGVALQLPLSLDFQFALGFLWVNCDADAIAAEEAQDKSTKQVFCVS